MWRLCIGLNKHRVLTAVSGLLIICLAFVYCRYDPAVYALFPKCPFHLLTGFDCPGCGSQRAIHALLHGRIGEAADYNVLLVASLPFLLVHAGFKASSLVTGKPARWAVIDHPLTPRIIFVLVIGFWVARNIPFSPFNYLAS